MTTMRITLNNQEEVIVDLLTSKGTTYFKTHGNHWLKNPYETKYELLRVLAASTKEDIKALQELLTTDETN